MGRWTREWSWAAHDLPDIRGAGLSVIGGKWVGLAVTLGRREADSHRHGLGDPASPHPCEGDVMPVLQMRKLRPKAEVTCQAKSRRPDLEAGQAWTLYGTQSAASLEDLLHAFPSCLRTAWSGRDPAARVWLGSAAGSGWRSFKASPSFLAELPGLTASLLQRKAASYLGLSPAN